MVLLFVADNEAVEDCVGVRDCIVSDGDEVNDIEVVSVAREPE
jgi:hypothetical protein